jgi:hypothetical protein
VASFEVADGLSGVDERWVFPTTGVTVPASINSASTWRSSLFSVETTGRSL